MYQLLPDDALVLNRPLPVNLWSPKGVTVNTVSPGYIGTDMVNAIRADVLEKIVATVPVKRLGKPSEIASIIAWLASEEGGYATGADFSVNGGLHMG